MLPIESLESRRMLNAVVAIQAKLSRTGLLTITGSSLADQIIVKQSGSQIEIVSDKVIAPGENDIVDNRVDIGKVKRIVVNASGGRDYVQVDAINSRKTIAKEINGDGANDTLVSRMHDVTLRGGAGNDYLVSEGNSISSVFYEYAGGGNQLARVLGPTTGTSVLDGGSGDDRLATRGGDDSVYGGDGQDTLVKFNDMDVYFADLAPQPTGQGFNIRTVRVAAFGVDKIIDQPQTTPLFQHLTITRADDGYSIGRTDLVERS